MHAHASVCARERNWCYGCNGPKPLWLMQVTHASWLWRYASSQTTDRYVVGAWFPVAGKIWMVVNAILHGAQLTRHRRHTHSHVTRMCTCTRTNHTRRRSGWSVSSTCTPQHLAPGIVWYGMVKVCGRVAGGRSVQVLVRKRTAPLSRCWGGHVCTWHEQYSTHVDIQI